MTARRRFKGESRSPGSARPDTEATVPGNREASGRVPRLYEQAFEILVDQIRRGALAPGSQLRETGIAAQFGISRAPARRALVELNRIGLIEKRAGRGYAVCPDVLRNGRVDESASEEDDVRLVPSASWERIYAEVEDEITARISFANWRVNEAKLSRHFGVSRTVARDVVARLQQRGLVRKDERSRWVAPALTPQHIGELYELRAILEPVALRKAAPHAPAALIRRMRHHLEDAIARNEQDGAALDRLEQELHVEFLGHCGHSTLMQAITMPQSLLVAHRFLYRWTPRLFESEPFLPEHLDVVRHLERREIDEAAKLLTEHLQVSGQRAVARVDAIRHGFKADTVSYLEQLDH